MNHIYKVVWSKVKNCYVVVSEIAHNSGKEHSSRTSHSHRKSSQGGLYALALAVALGLTSPSQADANPTDAKTVVDLGTGGSASYDEHGNLLVGKETTPEGANNNGENNTTIGTKTDTLRKDTADETKGQAMAEDNTKLVDGEGKAHELTTSTEASGSTAVGYKSHAEGTNSTAIGNNAKITDKLVTYYVDKDGNQTTSTQNAAWYKDDSGNPTRKPHVFRDADDNTTTTPQYKYTHTVTAEDGTVSTVTDITSDASKADKEDGQPVYNYEPSDNTSYLYSVQLYQSAKNSIAAGTDVTANGSNAVAVGYNSTADNSAVAVGDTAVAKENAVAIGKETTATENAVAIGKNTKASVEGSIALGKGSEADRSGGTTGWDPKTGTTSTSSGLAWKSGEGALSIGNGTASRQITGVAAGSEDTDAVNLAQLKNAMTHYYSVKTTEATDAAGNNNYLNDGATGNNALAAGVSAVAKGDNATAVGTNTYASGEDASAYGYRAAAMGKDSVSIGSGTSAQQEGSVAIGGHAQGYYAVQVGSGSTAQSAYSVAVGGHAKGDHSVEVGYGSTAQGSYSTSVGGHAIGNYSIAIGSSKDNWGYINAASAAGDNSIAIGGHTNSANEIAIGAGSATSGGQAITVGGSATGNQSVSVGNSANATTNQATAIGWGSSATGSQSTAVGGHAGDTNSTAVGQGANANYAYATAVGNSSVASGDHSTALGYGTSVQGSSSTAIGGASAKGSNVTAIGKNSTVGGYWSDSISDSTVIGGAHISGSLTSGTAIGSNASVTGSYGVALGQNASVAYQSTGVGTETKASNTGTAVGYGAQAHGNQSASVGAGSKATGQNAVALGGSGAWGDYSIALGSGAGTTAHAIALGQNSGAWGTNAIAIGEGSNAWRANSIVLGKNSKSGADKNIEGYDPRTGVASVDDTSIWQSTDEAVSIGRAEERDGDGNITATAITRQLNNLAAGTLDTDAVNVAQLKAATQKVNVHDYSVWSPNTETDTNYTNGGAVAKNSLAAGVSAKATGDSAVAIGNGAQAEGKGATVIGKNAKATGQYATAFGGLETTDKKGNIVNIINTASGASSTAFGQGAQAKGAASLAFGHNTVAGADDGSGQQSVAFGEDTQALGGRSLAFGEKTIAKYNDSVAFGNDTRASSTGATAFGNRTRALAQYSTAWGNATVAADEESTAWGTDTIAGAKLDENGAVTNKYTEDDTNKTEQMDVHGKLAYTYTSATDNKVHTAGIKQMPIDSGNEKHDYVVLAGKDGNTYVRDYQGSLWKVNVDADGNVTIDTTAGTNGKVYNGQKKTSLAKTTMNGSEVDITPDNVLTKAHEGTNGYNIDGYANATAFGYSTEASGDNATAFGNDTKAAAAGATAFGYKTLASGENSTAFGENSIAAGKNSLAALGATTTDAATNAAAIGSGAQATFADSVALGSNSKTTRAKYSALTDAKEKAAYAKSSTSTGSAWEATENAVAVGNDSTTTRQITGVAAGSLDTDAVNVAQLRAVDARHTTVSVGGQNATADNTLVKGGNLELKRTTTNGQYNYDVSLNKDITLGTQEEKNGGSLTINTLGAFHEKDEQGNQKDVPIKEAVKIDGSTISIVKHDGTDGENDQRQVVLGIGPDAGGYVVLYDKTGEKPTYIYNSITPGATYLQDGNSYTADKANEYGRLEYGDYYNGTTQFIATLDDGQKYAGDNYKAAETETKTVDGKTTTTIKTDEQNVLLKKLNERLDIKGGATGTLTNNNIGVNVKDGVMNVQLAQNIDLGDMGSVKMGNTTINNGGVTITTKNGDTTNTISLTENGLNNGGKTITNVGNGTKDSDAVNVSQLNAAKTTVKSSDNSISVTDVPNGTPNHAYDIKVATATFSNGTDGKVSVTNPDNNANSYATGNSVADAINNSGFTLTTSNSGGGSVSGTSTPLIKPGSTVTLDAGKNIVLNQAGSKVTIALSDDVTAQTITANGKNGNDGEIGLTGKNGADGKVTTIIKTIGKNGTDGKNGKPGINGTDGITRIVYQDGKDGEAGTTTHTVATLDDGLKFIGDKTDDTAIAKKLGEILTIKGDGTYDAAKKTNTGNIQTSVDGGAIKVALNKDINLKQDGSLTVGGDEQGGSDESKDPIVIKHFDNQTLDMITGVDKDGKPILANKKAVAGDYATGLDNKEWNVNNPEYVSGRAATEDQLKTISDAVNKAASTAGKHTVVTVENGKAAGTTDYNGENLKLKVTEKDGQKTYDLKLNDKVTLGKAGKDGVDGSIGLTGADGKSGIGLNGKDGISVIGKDGQNGVSITGSNGLNGENGIDGKIAIGTPGKDGQPGKDAVSISGKDGVGHIGLTGPKGADGTPGKDGISIDITTDLKSATLDDKKNVSTTIKDAASGKETTIEQAPRIQYKNGNNTYEVATMDDGQKYAGDFGKGASVKLNKTVNVKGNAKKEADLTDGNIGVVSSQSGDDGQLLIKLNKDLNLGNNGSVKMGNTTINNDGMTISKTESGKTTTVTLTDKGLDNGGNKITNVADGEISATSKDAVNGSQLNDVKTLAEQHTTVEAGPSGNVTVTPGTNADGSKKYTVDLAKDVTFGDAAKGDKTVAISGTNGTVTAGTGDDKVTVDGSKGQIVAGGDNGVKIGKIADGDGSLTIYDKDGKATGKTDKAGKYVTNLDNKTWNKDGSYVSGRAATEDQLHQVESNVNKQIADVNTKIDTVDKHHTEVTVNGGTAAKADGSYTDGNLQIAQKTGADGQKVYDLKLNDNLNIGGVGKDGKDGKDGHVGINGKDGKSGVGIDGKDGISVKGKDGQNGVTIKGVDDKDGTEGHIGLVGPKGPKGADGKDGQNASADIHVKNGQVGVDGTDGHGGKDGMDRVVYEDHNGTSHEVATMDDGMKYSGDSGNAAVKLNNNVQLYGGAKEYAAGDNIGVVVSQDGDNAKMQVKLAKDLKCIDSIDAKTVTTGNTTINNSGMTVKGDDKHKDITVQQGNVNMGGNKIEGVAPGKVTPDSTEAVNGSQLAQRDQAIGKLGGEVSSLDRRVDRVGAGAAALAALHPQDFDPDDKWDFAVGYGNYRGANAAAVGAFYRPNEDTTLSVGGTVGGGENMVNAGISFKFGQGNHVTNSRVAMAKEILALKDYVQKQDEKIEKLEALVGQQGTAAAPKRRSILFPDVPENHWAYVYVKKLADRGLLEGYPDGEFKGDRTITRYEFAAIFSRALENGASVDNDMERMSEEFEPEIRELSLNRFRVDRVEGKDNDRHKIERVRVNDRDELVKQKNGEQKKRYRDLYGSVIEKDAPADAAK